MICILAHEGRFLETILKDGARSGVPRTRREPPRREVRTPTASHRAWRGMSLQAPGPLPGASFVGPPPKIATVERRELSRSPRDGGSRVAGATEVKSEAVGAPSTPHWGCGSPSSRRLKAAGSLARRSLAKAGDRRRLGEAGATRSKQNPGATTRRGNEQ